MVTLILVGVWSWRHLPASRRLWQGQPL